MKTGGSERKTALGGPEEDGTINSVLFFDSQCLRRSGAISSIKTTGGLTVICSPEALINPYHSPHVNGHRPLMRLHAHVFIFSPLCLHFSILASDSAAESQTRAIR